jgi:hypothetical protein
MVRRMAREAKQRSANGQPSSAAQPWCVADLLRVHGDSSMAVVLIVIAMVTVLPVAGVGTLLSGAIVLWAWAWARQLEHLPGFARIEQLPLPSRVASRCLRWLAKLHLLRSRWFKARCEWIFQPAWRGLWAIWITAMALVIFLPIPFGNVLPALSLLLFGLALMAKDGVMMLVSTLPGLLGVGLLVASVDVLLVSWAHLMAKWG